MKSITPKNQKNGVAETAKVKIKFSEKLDPATVTATHFVVFGRISGRVAGTLALNAAGTTVTFEPSRPYFPSEFVSVSIDHDVKSLSNHALTRGFFSTFAVRGGEGSKDFLLDQVIDFREPNEGATRLYGFNAIDIDSDGDPDMCGTNEVSHDVRVRHNDGTGQFDSNTIVGLPGAEEPSPNDAGDLDGDGHPDLVTGNQAGNSIAYFENDGAGSFGAPVVYPVGGECHGIALVDSDVDGDLDVVATNLTEIRLFVNDGTGVLSHVDSFDGGEGEWQCAIGDADNDGRADCFVANFGSQDVGLLLADGPNSFAPAVNRDIGGTGWAIAVGDLDDDGNCDALCPRNSSGKAALVRGNGKGGLKKALFFDIGNKAVSADLADLDGDGDLDFTVANFGSANANLYWNEGKGHFVSGGTLDAEQSGSCDVLVDYDLDGDCDICVVDEITDRVYLYKQTGAPAMLLTPPARRSAVPTARTTPHPIRILR